MARKSRAELTKITVPINFNLRDFLLEDEEIKEFIRLRISEAILYDEITIDWNKLLLQAYGAEEVQRSVRELMIKSLKEAASNIANNSLSNSGGKRKYGKR